MQRHCIHLRSMFRPVSRVKFNNGLLNMPCKGSFSHVVRFVLLGLGFFSLKGCLHTLHLSNLQNLVFVFVYLGQILEVFPFSDSCMCFLLLLSLKSEKRPDSFQTQEIFVSTGDGLSTTQSDVQGMTWVCTIPTIVSCCTVFLVVCKAVDGSFWKAVQ